MRGGGSGSRVRSGRRLLQRARSGNKRGKMGVVEQGGVGVQPDFPRRRGENEDVYEGETGLQMGTNEHK